MVSRVIPVEVFDLVIFGATGDLALPRGGAGDALAGRGFRHLDHHAVEGLGEAVRADVLAKTGVQLDWEIKRIGRTTSGLFARPNRIG